MQKSLSATLHKIKERRAYFKSAALILMSVQIVIGLVWMVANWAVMVPYGDVPEYIRLAHTFVLDMWRPVAYPLFLRLCMEIAHPLGVPFYTVVHFLQCAACLAGLYYTLQTVWVTFFNDRRPLPALGRDTFLKDPSRRLLLFLTVFLFTNPLVLHFNLSVMTDSLCNTFSLVFVSAVLLILKGGRFDWRPVALGTAAFILMCLLRAERLMLMGVLMVVLAGVLAFKLRGPRRKQVIAAMAILLVVAIPMANVIKKETQTANLGRLPPSIHTALYQRIAYPYFADNYDAMPDSVKAVLTREDAKYSDAWQLNCNTIAAKVLREDPDHYGEILDAVWMTVLTHDTGRVFAAVFSDFAKDVFSPFIYNITTVHTVTTTDITWNRLRHGTPQLAYVYVTAAELAFWALTVLLLVRIIKNRRLLSDYRRLWAGLIVFVLIQSAFYASTSNYGFHIRYQLFNYSVQLIVGLMVLAVGDGPEASENGAASA